MKIVIVSPHPDDETLGAGGTILRYKEEGNAVYWINITDVSEKGGWSKEFVLKRKSQIKEISDIYQFDDVYNLKLPPARLEETKKKYLIEKIDSCFSKIEPDLIIIPDGNDAHSDHGVVFEACLACSKIFRHPSIKRIITMEIISETDFGKPYNPFIPNYYIDITNYIEKKIEAMKVYDSELGIHPFPRSLEMISSLASVRGSAAGCIYAEAFKIIKFVE